MSAERYRTARPKRTYRGPFRLTRQCAKRGRGNAKPARHFVLRHRYTLLLTHTIVLALFGTGICRSADPNATWLVQLGVTAPAPDTESISRPSRNSLSRAASRICQGRSRAAGGAKRRALTDPSAAGQSRARWPGCARERHDSCHGRVPLDDIPGRRGERPPGHQRGRRARGAGHERPESRGSLSPSPRLRRPTPDGLLRRRTVSASLRLGL
jgi:hypothetical protein